MHWKQKLLSEGKTIETSERGNSMVPLISSGQKHVLAPTSWESCKVGDIVFCKVRGNFYTHLVTGRNERRGLQISNNKGHVNGWTKQVFGKVVTIL